MATQEEILGQQRLLETHRRTLSHYLLQQAKLSTSFASPAVTHGIIEARENISRIKIILRGWGIDVEDRPDDGDVSIQDSTGRSTGSVDISALEHAILGCLSYKSRFAKTREQILQELCPPFNRQDVMAALHRLNSSAVILERTSSPPYGYFKSLKA